MNGVDEAHLRRALDLAEQGRRTVTQGAMVGCVLVRDDAILAEGFHARPGGPHAEAVALAAVADARGATAYVSLEPCAHHGRTPPCADALIAAGIARVVVAAGDPFPLVAGTGIDRLRAAGIDVEVADRASPIGLAARRQNAAYRTATVLGRPHVTYKAAVTVDGRTATRAGDSRWISGPESRRLVHEWRAAAGAVLVGRGTAIADDATLTARDCDPVAARQPLRVVADRSALLPITAHVVRTSAEGAVLVVVGPNAPASRRSALERAGVETAVAADAPALLALLHARGVQSVLLEGGPTLAGALLAAAVIDRLAVFVAPGVMGDPAAPGLFGDALAPVAIADVVPLASLEPETVGRDILLDGWLRDPP